jgi:hypothetical protein
MERVALRLWTMAVLIDGTIGETYLRAPRNYGSFPDILRFLPARGDVRNSSRGRARAYSHRRRPNAEAPQPGGGKCTERRQSMLSGARSRLGCSGDP